MDVKSAQRNGYKYKVSVVTAVYNVQNYVAEMIESILHQTLGIKNIQLILVDDGSTDDSGIICDSYAKKYPGNIFVYHKENGGVSSARNYGLKHVEGKYVNFCDSDDMLKRDALEKMYSFLEKNNEYVDVVSIPMRFIGEKKGEHPLNYKFNETRIIDLQKDYDCIQMAVNSAMIKRECMLSFDESLSFSEDSRLINEILLGKMRYGVIANTFYGYRKRDTGDSLLDICRSRPIYYNVAVKKFAQAIIQVSKNIVGYIPKFIQYICLYNLYWRFKAYPLVQSGVLNDKEIEDYTNNIKDVLSCIESEVVMNSRILDSYKCAVIKLNNPNEYKLSYSEDGNQLRQIVGDCTFCNIGLYPAFFEFIHFDNSYMQLEGYVRGFLPSDTFKLYVAFDNDSERYYADLHERNNKCDYFLGEVITYATQFTVVVPIKNRESSKLGLYLDYNGKSVKYENIRFAKFFPLSEKLQNSYFYNNGTLIKWYKNEIYYNNDVSKTKLLGCEISLLWELFRSRDRYVRRGVIVRVTYHILKHFKRKQIWIIGDRPGRADDNGEALFEFLCTMVKNPNISVFFMLNKDSNDFSRVSKIGKVIDFHSIKYKMLALLCDVFAFSQGDDWTFNSFDYLMYIYKDIMYSQRFVFLQHGIIKDDLSRWLNRYNKNIDIFVVSTQKEYESVLECDYGYTGKQVKLTGLPRYDYLYDDSNNKNVITIMPTWRQYLVGNYDLQNDTRVVLNKFDKTAYCLMYKSLFNNSRLFEALKNNGYEIQLMLHPAMPRECITYFEIGNEVKVLDLSTRYRDIYAMSKIVITDYSSAVFDFAYLKKPILYYQADKDEFFSGKHIYEKGYFDYEKDGFGEVAYDVEKLVDFIIEYINNGCVLKEKYLKRINNTFYYHDKNNCARVYEQLLRLN